MKVLVSDTNLINIADSIREKTGEDVKLTPGQMSIAISGIPVGITPTGSIDITENGTYDVTEKASAVVNVPTPEPKLQDKTIEITENGTTTVSKDTGYDGIDSVAITTNVPSKEPTLVTKTITENGTYKASDDNADGYSSVEINVAGGGGGKVKVPDGMTIQNTTATTETIQNFIDNIDTSELATFTSFIRGCSNLTSLDLSKLDTSKLASTQYMFFGDTVLKSINFGNNFDTSNLVYAQYTFQGCSSLTSLDLSKWNFSKCINMGSMFSGCNKLAHINLDGVQFSEKNTSMYAMFQNCNVLEEINTSNFKANAVSDMQNMFAGCKKITSLDLSSFNTLKLTNVKSMFSECNNLQTINFGNTFITTKVTGTNMQNMFYRCWALDDDTLNNILLLCANSGVTSTSYKKLSYIGFSSSYQTAEKIQGLSNYQAFTDAGWVIGY